MIATYAVDENPQGRTCVYRLYDADNRLLYIGMSRDPKRRWAQHQAQRKPWWPDVVSRQVVWFPTRVIAEVVEREAIKEEHPLHNVKDGYAKPRKPKVHAGPLGIQIQLDWVMRQRGMTLTELADRMDMHINNLSRIKLGKIKLIGVDVLADLCYILECQPGDLLVYVEPEIDEESG